MRAERVGFLALLWLGLALLTPAFAQQPGDVIPDQYIVVLQEGVSVPGVVAEHGLAPFFTYTLINGFAARIPPERVGFLARDNRVAIIERDAVVTAFPVTGKPGGGGDVTAAAQTLPTGVNRINADVALANGHTGAGVKVAIIDTGIDTKHPDLGVSGGINYSGGRTNNFNDGNGHGTHVAGTVAARNNTIGVVGVAPGALLYAVKVLNNAGFGTWSGVIAGLDYAVKTFQVKVANMSLGGPSNSSMCTAVRNAVTAGVTVVVAAGNESTDARDTSPANCGDAITVSAIADSDGAPGGLGPATSWGRDDTFAEFSNFGSVVDIAAPGVDIYSTYKGSSYATLSGTSMATPHVSGAAALYIATYKAANGVYPSVANVVSGLLSNAWAQTSAQGFTGDPDSSHEPLVNAGGL